MKLASMIGDILEGLSHAPVTERYPYERHDTPTRLRGKLLWCKDACTACGLCAKDCPADALAVLAIDKKAKQIVLRYHVDRCTFCAQCVTNCRQGCLTMSSLDWELAALDRQTFTLYYGDETDVQAILAGNLEGNVP